MVRFKTATDSLGICVRMMETRCVFAIAKSVQRRCYLIDVGGPHNVSLNEVRDAIL